MSIVVYLFIMQIGTISTLMLAASLAWFAYHAWRYAKVWWDTPSNEPVVFITEFWVTRKKQSIVMGLLLVIGMSLPSRTEAVTWYAAYKAANSSVWDRLFTEERVDSVLERTR